MRSRRGLGLLIVLALGVGLLPTRPAFAEGCEFRLGTESHGGTCEGQLGWSYNPSARTLEYGSVIASTSAKADDPYEYKETYACDGNASRSSGNAGCSKAFNCPPKFDPDGEPMRGSRIAAFRRLKTHPYDPWQTTSTGVCQYTGKSVPMIKVVDELRDYIKKHVGRPTIIAQPPGGVTLVNFTSLFHAPEQTRTSLSITKPVSGEITAIPEYTWDLGDGITAEGSGHPYDEGTDPKSPDSDGYYVKAVYKTPGIKNVQLKLTWHASITLQGGAIPLQPIIFTAETTTTAKTATARLYAR